MKGEGILSDFHVAFSIPVKMLRKTLLRKTLFALTVFSIMALCMLFTANMLASADDNDDKLLDGTTWSVSIEDLVCEPVDLTAHFQMMGTRVGIVLYEPSAIGGPFMGLFVKYGPCVYFSLNYDEERMFIFAGRIGILQRYMAGMWYFDTASGPFEAERQMPED